MSETVLYRAPCPGCGAEARWVTTAVMRKSQFGEHTRVPSYQIECPTKGCKDG